MGAVVGRTAFRLLAWCLALACAAAAALALSAATTPAEAAGTRVFYEDFEACQGTGPAKEYATAIGTSSPTYVRLYGGAPISCPGWTAKGQAWLADSIGGTPFPSPKKAVWLNEGGPGEMTTTVTGLQTGVIYRLSAVAWTDNIDENTQFEYDFGPLSGALPMARGTGQQSISGEVCAASHSLPLTIRGSTISQSSPLADDVALDDTGKGCLVVSNSAMTVAVGATATEDLRKQSTWRGGLPPQPLTFVVTGGDQTGKATISGDLLSYTPGKDEPAGTKRTLKYRACPTGETATPPCADGEVDIAVTGAAAPTVGSLSPTTGSSSGGTTITITGSGFLPGATVQVGGSDCTNIKVVSYTSITCTTPTHVPGKVDVTVTNSDKQTVTAKSVFTYTSAPISKATPEGGSPGGGTRLTIVGGPFPKTATVAIGDVPCRDVVNSATTISCTTPPHEPGLVDLEIVELDDGVIARKPNAFRYAKTATVKARAKGKKVAVGSTTTLVKKVRGRYDKLRVRTRCGTSAADKALCRFQVKRKTGQVSVLVRCNRPTPKVNVRITAIAYGQATRWNRTWRVKRSPAVVCSARGNG